jgi:hypothetical protein
MATIGRALVTIKSRLGEFVDPALVTAAVADAGIRFRRRTLDPLTTVHLLLLQLLAGVSMTRLDRVAQLTVSAAAICKARMRLPLCVWRRLVEITGRCGSDDPAGSFAGHRVVVADGTTFTTADVPTLARKYGKASNQRSARPGYPMPKLLALMDLATGMIHKVIDLPCARGEQTVLSRMFRVLQPDDLLLADRGLISFAHVALMMQARVHCLLRLPKNLIVKGRGRGNRRLVERLGRQDLLVCWDKPQRRPVAWISRQRWKLLPATLRLRQIAYRMHRRGFRTQWGWLITTLDCPQKYAAQPLIELYGRRWQIEVCFRDLKRSLGMRKMSARTVDGARKEILAFVALYNLIRRVMKQAAERQGVDPDRISFLDTATAVLWLDPDEPMPDLIVNERRERDTEPRVRKHGGHQFPLLHEPREDLRKPRATAKIGAALS